MTFRIKNLLIASLMAAVTAATGSAQVVSGMGSLPLYFEARGQAGDTQFLARSRDGEVLISANGAELNLRNEATVQAQFLGASPQAQIHGDAELAAKINYLTGNNPAQWRTGIPTFSKVRIENLYPGVDAVYYGNQQQLEYDLNVAPGASPEPIVIRFTGVDKISVNAQGQLALFAGKSEIDQARPVMYQTVAGVRREIEGGYKILDARTVGFTIGQYDHRLPLVIDPILSFSTYFGGLAGTGAYAMALYTNDNSVFITGSTLSENVGTNSYQTNYQGGIHYGDAYVAKFNLPGPGRPNAELAYCTYLGGAHEDLGDAIAVDSAGRVFVGGYTDSTNFPVKNPPAGVSTNIGGTIIFDVYQFDGFVAELDPTGTTLIYSTYLGGSGADGVFGLAIDSADNAYATGYTFSTNFPVLNPIPFKLAGRTNTSLGYLACTNTFFNCNAFITKINAGGAGVGFSTYFGGNNYDVGTAIAVDSANNVFVTGYTSSTNFPNTNAFQPFLNQNDSNIVYRLDAFVAKLAPTPTHLNLVYSTFLGNTNDDEAHAIAVDSQDAAYVTGWTTSTNFYNNRKTTIPSYVTNNADYIINTTNVFLTKITNNVDNSSAGNRAGIDYSVVFGGHKEDIGYGVAVDAAGDAFVTGSSTSGNFYTNNYIGFLRATNSGYHDAFVTAFDPVCSNVLYSVHLGGTKEDYGYAIAVDADSSAYVVGVTKSTNFPVTVAITNMPVYNDYQQTLGGTNDGFIAKIIMAPSEPALSIAAVKPNKVTLSWSAEPEVQPAFGTFSLQSSPLFLMTNFESQATMRVTNGVTVTILTNQVTVTNWLTTTNWVTYTNAATLIGSNNVITLPATNGFQFFRLYQHP
jgi:hypothetical protein